jgi:hypothetical protein
MCRAAQKRAPEGAVKLIERDSGPAAAPDRQCPQRASPSPWTVCRPGKQTVNTAMGSLGRTGHRLSAAAAGTTPPAKVAVPL